MESLTYLFWICGALILYPYIGYPVFLGALSLFSKRNSPGAGPRREAGAKERPRLPSVTMLISAYNEEKVIEEKLDNALALDYPADLLEWIVVSDGSTDRTDAIAGRYSDKGVRLMRYEGRMGKTACLNETMPKIKGDIVVFSDANSLYDKDAVANIVRWFSDPSIGFVTGYTKYRRAGEHEGIRSIGLYAGIEKMTKALESKVGSCVGADGAIFGMRKELFRPLKEYDINDLVLPLSVVRQGYRGILDEHAYCVECSAGDIQGEYQRQTRITNRALRAIFNNADLFNPLNSGIFSMFLFSHKLMKYLVPFFLVGLFLSSTALVGSGTVYTAAFLAQCTFLVIALQSGRKGRTAFSSRIFTVISDFIIINAAVMQGWMKFFRHERFTTWSPTRR